MIVQLFISCSLSLDSRTQLWLKAACVQTTQEPLLAFSIDYSQIHKVQAVRALCVWARHLPGVNTLTLCVHSSTPARNLGYSWPLGMLLRSLACGVSTLQVNKVTLSVLVGTFLLYFLTIIFILRSRESFLPLVIPWLVLPSSGVNTTKWIHVSEQWA